MELVSVFHYNYVHAELVFTDTHGPFAFRYSAIPL
jgi:hypothetical protein